MPPLDHESKCVPPPHHAARVSLLHRTSATFFAQIMANYYLIPRHKPVSNVTTQVYYELSQSNLTVSRNHANLVCKADRSDRWVGSPWLHFLALLSMVVSNRSLKGKLPWMEHSSHTCCEECYTESLPNGLSFRGLCARMGDHSFVCHTFPVQ